MSVFVTISSFIIPGIMLFIVIYGVAKKEMYMMISLKVQQGIKDCYKGDAYINWINGSSGGTQGIRIYGISRTAGWEGNRPDRVSGRVNAGNDC